ncbi:hypothetical protein GGX14DRAFT_483207 [Mycena pura]|uniref:Uncharacterized protein n=1 Tax=Mycena pura TaxID=153505 RepID=A0AAD6XY73_9AGAR|nr:hypothetical protein GGX14DRAFT_483207 [Mycena pura]
MGLTEWNIHPNNLELAGLPAAWLPEQNTVSDVPSSLSHLPSSPSRLPSKSSAAPAAPRPPAEPLSSSKKRISSAAGLDPNINRESTERRTSRRLREARDAPPRTDPLTTWFHETEENGRWTRLTGRQFATLHPEEFKAEYPDELQFAPEVETDGRTRENGGESGSNGQLVRCVVHASKPARMRRNILACYPRPLLGAVGE